MIDLLNNAFNLGLTAVAVLVLRIIMMPLLIYNITWSFKGFFWLVRGAAFPTSIYQSVVFLMCSGLVGYHTLAFMGRAVSVWSLPFSLILQCVFFTAAILAFIGRRIAVVSNFEKFYSLFQGENLEIAVRAAEINQMDPEFARTMLSMAEETVAVRIARKAISDGSS